LTTEGKVTLEVSYPFKPAGELKGQFTLDEEVLRELRNAIESERFFDLPATLSSKPIPMHAPDLRLDIQVGNKHHKVMLYNPKQIREEATTKRVLKVWDKLYAGLPLRPTW
jgi:hypothetical protein